MAEQPGAGHVVFVGMMGSGKTTVGRKVARRLEVPFVDVDEEIESSTGMEIAEWFANRGEVAFRDAEEAAMAELLGREQAMVIATGGGAVLRAGTRARLTSAACTVVWLRASPQFLYSRVQQKAERQNRPLLRSDPAGALERLDAQRRDFYAEVADMVVDIEPILREVDKPKKALANLIVDTLAVAAPTLTP